MGKNRLDALQTRLTEQRAYLRYRRSCFNEYAEMAYCGVPGRLVNWISRIEDEKVTGCLPFWHQANNLNDLAASANEGNGAWWLYKWYGDMSGVTQTVESSTEYDLLYGVSHNGRIQKALLRPCSEALPEMLR